MKNPSVAELFSGAGLFGAGFKQAGFQNVYAAELDARAVATYAENVSPHVEVRDIRNVKAELRCSTLLAGPPCQGFSTLGRRDPRDERNSLSMHVFQWAKITEAKVVVVENVPPFLESDHWKRLTGRFSKAGFEYCAWVLNAFDFGVPQRRTRSFTIYSRIGLPKEPKGAKVRYTVADAFDGLSKVATGKNFHIAPIPSDIAMRRMKLVPRGGDRRDVLLAAPELCPPSWQKVGCQATDAWGRMTFDKPANTIRCCFQNASKGRYLHPDADRVISLREGARLQGIPDSWQFHGDNASIARQIGNGVPVPLAEAIGRSIRDLFA